MCCERSFCARRFDVITLAIISLAYCVNRFWLKNALGVPVVSYLLKCHFNDWLAGICVMAYLNLVMSLGGYRLRTAVGICAADGFPARHQRRVGRSSVCPGRAHICPAFPARHPESPHGRRIKGAGGFFRRPSACLRSPAVAGLFAYMEWNSLRRRWLRLLRRIDSVADFTRLYERAEPLRCPWHKAQAAPRMLSMSARMAGEISRHS